MSAYTSLSNVSVDLQLYVTMSNKGAYSLAQFPSLAKQRYAWIVDNWHNLYPTFKTFANGDQDLEAALADFKSSVDGYKLTTSGTPLNALNNQSKFELYEPFLELLAVNNLGLNGAENSLVNNELQRISRLSIDDFKSMLEFMNNYMTVYSSSIGLYDEEGFKAINGIAQKKSQTATISDLDKIDQQIEIRKYIESIIVSLKSVNDKPPNLLAVANTNIANGSGAGIQDIYSSSVSIPFEISLEHMALMFMGRKSLWYELVTVNNLQPPYIDEVGLKYKLVAPGAVSSVAISDERKNDLHVGAQVKVGSVKEREETRYINKMIYNSDGTMVLYLSGEANLSRMKTTEGAYVRVFAPHTVNTGSFIKIPLTIGSSTPNSPTPQSDELRRLEKALLNFGVDVAQSEKGDIAVSPTGNFSLAFGVNNVRQAVLNQLNTVQGELDFHKQYGLNVSLGAKFFGAPDVNILSILVVDTILKDKRISSARVTDVSFNGSSVSVLIEVQIQGSSKIIPLSYVG